MTSVAAILPENRFLQRTLAAKLSVLFEDSAVPQDPRYITDTTTVLIVYCNFGITIRESTTSKFTQELPTTEEVNF